MVARHAKFESFPWIRLDTAHALLERSYASSHSIVDQAVRIALLMPVFGRSAASIRRDRDLALAPRLFLATESTGTVLTPSQMSEIAGHGLQAVLQRLASAGLTLNGEKCLFSVSQLRFCGYLIGKDGIRPDPAKVTALTEMPACKDVHDVRRFLGLANQLGRFSPNLASLSQPLRDLLVKRNSWCWTESHQTAFDRIKAELSSQPVLALYSPNYETVVSADASSYGLGAVLTQRQPDTGLFRPVVYLSRSLTDTERRYSQIEKEALATTWACERLSNYLIGLPFTVETDHKPLVPLLGTKALDELPPRVLRFRLRLMRYQFNIVHVPGKNLITADALSRAPADVSSVADSALEQEVDAFMAAVTDSLPVTDQRLQEILRAQQDDPICMTIGSYCSVGWPPQDRLCHVCVDLTHLAYDVLSCYGLYRRMLAIVLSS